MSVFLKRLFIFIITPFLVAFSIELIARLVHIPKIAHFNINAKAQNLIPQIDSNTILILGDSRLEWGIRPILLNEKLKTENTKVLNLATPGSNGLDILQYLENNNISPKLIVMGITENYGSYTNFGHDKSTYDWKNKVSKNLKYKIKSNLYLSDKSLLMFLKSKPIYFKKFEHDCCGGGYVCEYGNYKERLNFQVELYTTWRKDYDLDLLSEYKKELNGFIDYFADKTKIVGISMPVSNCINDIETIDTTFRKDSGIHYAKYYDLSGQVYKYQNYSHDSLYFLDGSHLTDDYASQFTMELADRLNNEFFINL